MHSMKPVDALVGITWRREFGGSDALAHAKAGRSRKRLARAREPEL
jgi:hypothetical protein